VTERTKQPALPEPWQTLLSLLGLSLLLGCFAGFFVLIGSMVLEPTYRGDSMYPPLTYRLGLDTFLLGTPGIGVIVAAFWLPNMVLQHFKDRLAGNNWIAAPVFFALMIGVLWAGFTLLRFLWGFVT